MGALGFDVAEGRLQRFVTGVPVVGHDELQLGLPEVATAHQLFRTAGEGPS